MAEGEKMGLARIVACPKCRKTTRYDASNEYRPFCSARCKNEDIVAWAEENYKVPAESAQAAGEGDEVSGDGGEDS